jgi:hypothetical protein
MANARTAATTGLSLPGHSEACALWPMRSARPDIRATLDHHSLLCPLPQPLFPFLSAPFDEDLCSSRSGAPDGRTLCHALLDVFSLVGMVAAMVMVTCPVATDNRERLARPNVHARIERAPSSGAIYLDQCLRRDLSSTKFRYRCLA